MAVSRLSVMNQHEGAGLLNIQASWTPWGPHGAHMAPIWVPYGLRMGLHESPMKAPWAPSGFRRTPFGQGNKRETAIYIYIYIYIFIYWGWGVPRHSANLLQPGRAVAVKYEEFCARPPPEPPDPPGAPAARPPTLVGGLSSSIHIFG